MQINTIDQILDEIIGDEWEIKRLCIPEQKAEAITERKKKIVEQVLECLEFINDNKREIHKIVDKFERLNQVFGDTPKK